MIEDEKIYVLDIVTRNAFNLANFGYIFSAIKQEDIPEEAKKPKIEEPTEEDKLFKEHLVIFYKYKDQLKKMTKGELTDLLTYNDQEVPIGQDAVGCNRLCSKFFIMW